MESAYLTSAAEALKHFSVTEEGGLSDSQVKALTAEHGRNGTELDLQCELAYNAKVFQR